MQHNLRKGQLTSWKDDRGFGFIKPDNGGKDVFLHISSLKGAGRRPRVGDTIWYEQAIENNGKIRATKARIQGVVARPAPAKISSQKTRIPELSIGTVGRAALTLVALVFCLSPFFNPPAERGDQRDRSDLPTTFEQPGCFIKGNISVTTGRRLYHQPGMEDYEATIIDPEKGERWFCTEADAMEAGWVKAPR